jgi:serine/threonine-protein kinase
VLPSYEVALAIVAQAAEGLDHAHRRRDAQGRPLGLVHRDVSLSNIMVGHDGGVKIVDFGIAQSTLSTVPAAPGVVLGKASYMSPEQCAGEPVDLRTDVFALGIVLYELTTGARCFDGMLAIVHGRYARPREVIPDFPPGVAAVIARALATDADDRYRTCADLVDALEDVLRAHGWLGGSAAIARAMREVFAAPRSIAA